MIYFLLVLLFIIKLKLKCATNGFNYFSRPCSNLVLLTTTYLKRNYLNDSFECQLLIEIHHYSLMSESVHQHMYEEYMYVQVQGQYLIYIKEMVSVFTLIFN